METAAQTKKWFSYKKKNVYFIKYLLFKYLKTSYVPL